MGLSIYIGKSGMSQVQQDVSCTFGAFPVALFPAPSHAAKQRAASPQPVVGLMASHLSGRQFACRQKASSLKPVGGLCLQLLQCNAVPHIC